ncbi:hypothetical protein VTO73DRAFT_5936 [Trametes versicolor]
MSTLARQLNANGHDDAFQLPAEDENMHTWPSVSESFLMAQLEEEDDDVDLYYFSADSDSSMSSIPGEASSVQDIEVEEEMMPGGWPAATASRISSPTPWKPSRVRPQSIIVDGLRITVTLPEDASYDCYDGHYLVGSDSAASFFTASESVMDIHLLSASPTNDFLYVPAPVLAPSPSVLFILEEFACSPPLPTLSFDDAGEANLWAMSRSPSSVGLLTPPENDLLAPGIVPSPEFASNFAQAGFPELVCHSLLAPISASPSHYPWFDSLLDQYLSDDEFAGAGVQDESYPKAYPFYNASTQVRDEDVPVYNTIVTSDSQESPCVSFEDLWHCARAGTFTEALPASGPRACGPALEVNFGEACTMICATASAYEMDDLLGLYVPSEPEPMGVRVPACLAEGALLFDEDEEYYRTPSAIDLTGAGPHPDERLAKAARETFWQMWTRRSDEDLALFFKCSDDAPSGLHIFVEGDARRTPLPGSKNDSSLIKPLDRPFGAREQVKQEHRDAFLELWNESLKQAYL